MTDHPDLIAAARGIALAPSGSLAKLQAIRAAAASLAVQVRHGIIEKRDVVDRLRDEAIACGVVGDVGEDPVLIAISEGLRNFTNGHGGPYPAHGAARERAEPASEPPRIKASPHIWQQPHTIPPRRWLYGRHYIRRYITATVAAGGVGKSSVVLVEALAMVTGRDLLGERSKRPLRVWYWNGEDPLEEVDRRIAAVCKHFGISADDIGDRLFRDSGRIAPIIIATKVCDLVAVNVPAIEALTRELKGNHIDCLMIDPFVSSHNVPENDNGAVDRVASAYAGIAEAADCSIELVHHMRKPSTMAERTVDDARGAVALIAAARSARVLNVMTNNEAEAAGVAADQRAFHFHLDNGKANMQPPLVKATWRKLISVPLGNATNEEPEDCVGVATKWELPNPFEHITVADLDRVRELIRDGRYRADIRAKDWVGHAVAEVLGLDLETSGAREMIKKVLAVWFKTKALIAVEQRDNKGNLRQFVLPGPGPEGSVPRSET
jgi:AAA domain-containing protein